MVTRIGVSLGWAVMVGAFALSCAEKSSERGGETNWACTADADCDRDEACVEHECVGSGAGETGGSSGSGGEGGGASSGSGGAGTAGDPPIDGAPPVPTGECADVNLGAVVANPGPTVSFENDVMPIFGASCTASDCHKDPEKKAGLFLGYRCRTDPVTKVCTFPDVVDPNTTSSNPPRPLTQDIIDAVHANLMSASATSPSHQRVVPASPAESFLVLSLLGEQNHRGYTDCVNQDTSHEAVPEPCGASMPLNSPPLCVGSSRPKFLTIVRWIAQGAPKN